MKARFGRELRASVWADIRSLLPTMLSRVGCARWMIAASVIGLSSCGSETTRTQPVGRYDSAGVTIVESRRPLWGDSGRWSIDSLPIVDLTLTDTGAEHEFDRVRSMIRLSDGSLVVANTGTQEIRRYTPAGVFVGSTGRAGEGPGDFRNIQHLERGPADTLLVLDYDGRVTVLTPDLTLARTFDLGRATDINYLGQGVLLVTMEPFITSSDANGAGLVRAPDALWTFDLSGTAMDSIAETGGREEYVFSVAGRQGTASPLFRKEAQVATADNRILRGNADFMEIEELARDGRVVAVFRVAGFSLDLSARQIREEREARLGDDPHPFVREVEAQLPDPAGRPAYSDILTGPTGTVWLRPYLGVSERGRREEWEVLSPDGAWLGSVGTRPGFRIFEIGSNTVLGVWRDEVDVEHPMVFGLRRNSEPRY